MNLAPVVDVLSNPRSPIGDRSYGANPALVAKLSVAAVRGYQRHGLAATAKHFIGLGHTSTDSHQALPTVTQTLTQLERVDLVPFRSAIAAGVSALLVAHVALPAIDSMRRPASLSPVIIGGLIRKHLGFNGVVMTDSLAMGALPEGGTAAAAAQAVAAGADMLLISADHDIASGVIDDAIARVISAVRAGRVSESRLDSAVARILALKRVYPPVIVG
jgi:beta-N-acetylhexosaminidase